MASTFTLPDFPFSTNEDEDYDGEDYEEGDSDGEGDGEEYDEDLDAEAEAMAKRLGDQLLADIAKAQAEVAAATTVGPATTTSLTNPLPPQLSPLAASPRSRTQASSRKKQDAALLTMKAVLSFATKHSAFGSIMSSAHVPGAEGGDLTEVFNRCISSSSISKTLARALAEVILSLAKSDVLSGTPRHPDALAQQVDKGKRKRDQTDDGTHPEHPQKRVAIAMPVDQPDLLHQINEALRIVSDTLSGPSSSPHNVSIDPGMISSIQLQLHQIFLFAVTSAPRAGEGRMQALQELAGLVQMLGVLSGIHIGNPPPQWPGVAPEPPPPDIGTAVYPCLVPGCPKTFHRLYSLRTHQRLHTLEHRPYRCAQCPASFVRNHDLKRHALLHDKKAWRCAGCSKIFSRRDAIKRHKDARGRALGGKGRPGEAADAGDTACAFAEVEEVEVDRAEGEEEVSRRAKLWNGIAASSAGGSAAEHMGPEEGEVDPAVVHQAQNMVLQVHGLLQALVTKGLGGPPPPPTGPVPMAAPQLSQSTLASIIARAQQHSSASPETPSAAPPPATEEQQPPSADEPMTFPEEPMSIEPPLETDSASAPPPLSLSWLSEEQTRLLEQAIAQAASAAQAQAEAEAALEEEGEEFEEDAEEYEEE